MPPFLMTHQTHPLKQQSKRKTTLKLLAETSHILFNTSAKHENGIFFPPPS